MRIEFHPEAEEELIEGSVFYELRVSGLGSRLIDEVQQATELLAERPELGQRIDEVFHRMVLHRFPYSLIYSAEADRLWVVAVAHQSRRPGYWRDRTDR
jgi:plasmid stabilization system protein ParE